MQFLVEQIRRDYGINAFEAYFIFDADNLLNTDYISRMNDSFDAGEKIVTSYRNTKNFNDNWIAASYGVHWLRTVRNEHRARSLFRLATRIQGTGFMFASEIIENGWNYTSLTEDRAFCADAVVNGYTISYNNDAVFYDEQPVDIKIAMRQRIRWAKGHIQAFFESGPKLFIHIFKKGKGADRYLKGDETSGQKFVLALRYRFMSFDMLTTIYPRSLFTFFRKWIVCILRIILIYGAALKVYTVYYSPGMFRPLFPDFFSSYGKSAIMLALFTLLYTLSSYIEAIFTAVYIYIIEYRRIAKIKWYKKIWYCITFPMFDLIGKISLIIALFKKVEWKPIPHNAARSIEEITKK